MAKLTPDQIARKQADRLKAASAEFRSGVESVTQAPGQLAAQAQAKMRAGILDAIDSGRWASAVSAVSLADWKARMIEKGLPRLASGVDAAIPKMTKFYQALISYQDSLKSEIDRMPSMTLEDNINRMTTWVRRMAEFKKPTG